MSTGAIIESLKGQLARNTPATRRAELLDAFKKAATALGELKALKASIDAVVAAAQAAEKPVFELEVIQADWAGNIADTLDSLNYSGKDAEDAFAQFIADLSEQRGAEGTVAQMRLTVGPSGEQAIVVVSQDQ